ncbi:MAG: tannase/feruloyl esterase family alpha/beta hydrolase, partial [Novosphingobium sp.]|nr:tannase/feruloyl esterase family alpha/beta hydrolase [Novosphingobium sp.]
CQTVGLEAPEAADDLGLGQLLGAHAHKNRLGRELVGDDAIVAATHFPEEFDGLIAGSPYLTTAIAFQAAGMQLASLRSEAAVIPKAMMALVDQAVKARCDATDGFRDGLIQNPMACNFRPERDLPRCGSGSSTNQCFTDTQIETLSAVLTAVTDEAGRVVQPAYSVSELDDQFNWAKRPADLATLHPFVETGTTRHSLGVYGDAQIRVFARRNDPNFATRSIIRFGAGGKGPIRDFRIQVPAREVEFLRSALKMGFASAPSDLDTFIARKGKLLLWVNLSDQLLTPYHTVNFYKQLAARHKGYARLQDSVRMFLLPNTAHCSGGVGPSSFDPLSALEEWVEHGKAPNALVASQYDPADFDPFAGRFDMTKPLRTMPLCAFPAMARYKGSGDVNDAANWFCPQGDRSMLRLGESGRRAGIVR